MSKLQIFLQPIAVLLVITLLILLPIWNHIRGTLTMWKPTRSLRRIMEPNLLFSILQRYHRVSSHSSSHWFLKNFLIWVSRNSCIIAPYPPRQVKVTATSSSTIKIEWQPPERSNGELEKYVIQIQEPEEGKQWTTRNYCVERKCFLLSKNISLFAVVGEWVVLVKKLWSSSFLFVKFFESWNVSKISVKLLKSGARSTFFNCMKIHSMFKKFSK